MTDWKPGDGGSLAPSGFRGTGILKLLGVPALDLVSSTLKRRPDAPLLATSGTAFSPTGPLLDSLAPYWECWASRSGTLQGSHDASLLYADACGHFSVFHRHAPNVTSAGPLDGGALADSSAASCFCFFTFFGAECGNKGNGTLTACQNKSITASF